MATKKYYWLKMKRDFFKRHDIRIIEEMPNGKDYVLFYLKLLLESIDHCGELRFSETIPYNEQMLAVITNTNIDLVRSAMKVFVQLKMVEMLDDETIYMTEVKKMVGSETASAERVRKHRAKLDEKQLLLQSNSNVTKCNTEIEIEKEIDIEIEKERELETGHPAPAAYGRYHNVILSDTELDGLKTELPGKWEYYIDRLSCHIASSGRKYKSHAATIFKWAQEDAAKKAPKKGIPDYTCKEGESL